MGLPGARDDGRADDALTHGTAEDYADNFQTERWQGRFSRHRESTGYVVVRHSGGSFRGLLSCVMLSACAYLGDGSVAGFPGLLGQKQTREKVGGRKPTIVGPEECLGSLHVL